MLKKNQKKKKLSFSLISLLFQGGINKLRCPVTSNFYCPLTRTGGSRDIRPTTQLRARLKFTLTFIGVKKLLATETSAKKIAVRKQCG